jgi:hypothetical protein
MKTIGKPLKRIRRPKKTIRKSRPRYICMPGQTVDGPWFRRIRTQTVHGNRLHRPLLGPRGHEGPKGEQDKYKQPSDQQTGGFLLKCLKRVFIVSNKTKSASYMLSARAHFKILDFSAAIRANRLSIRKLTNPMPSKITPVLTLCLTAGTLLCSCLTAYHQQAYYTSPFNGSSESYHTLPLHTDSAPTNLFVQGSLFTGAANDLLTDDLSGGSISAYLTQHQGMWQWWGGLDLTAGSYTLGNWHTRYAGNGFFDYEARFLAPTTADQLNTLSGSRFFGGAGFSGGVNAVVPMGQGEWRFLGIETNLHQEFGDYLHFRRHLADSLATYIVRQPFLGTLGLTSEWIFRTKQGDFGFRIAYGWALGGAYNPSNLYDSVSQKDLHYNYSSLAFHYTFGQNTVYVLGENATKGGTVRVGFIYRFGRPRLPPKQANEESQSRRQPPPGPRRPPWPPWRRPDN